jgi:triacylglycerol esterase/lipase EstA (alpha/beta hydrolase family)
MIARLQQAITLSLLAAGGLWLAFWWSRGHGVIAVVGTVVLFTGHAAVLGWEYLLLTRVRMGDPTPHATGRQLVRAWAAEAVQAPRVFCWRQPFFWRRFPDHLPPEARGRRGVLLVHGFVCNRGLWNPWLPRLRARGVPFIAVNLEPAFGSIDAYADTLQQALQRLRDATGVAPVVVAHSMGGLAVRAWRRAYPLAPAPHHVVTVATPHQGTWLGRFGQTANTRQMRWKGAWVRQLAADEQAAHGQRFTCFYSHCDNIVFPPSAATLPGADNRHLPGWSHVHLAYHPAVFDELLRLLQTPPP